MFFRSREKTSAIIRSLIGAVFLYMMTASTNMTVIVACLYIATSLLMLVFSAIVNLPTAWHR